MRRALYIIVGVLAFIALLTYFTLGSKRYTVEVCMAFNGRQNCGRASGTTKPQALRAASDNACALIASGVGDTIACSNNQPVSVKWAGE